MIPRPRSDGSGPAGVPEAASPTDAGPSILLPVAIRGSIQGRCVLVEVDRPLAVGAVLSVAAALADGTEARLRAAGRDAKDGEPMRFAADLAPLGAAMVRELRPLMCLPDGTEHTLAAGPDCDLGELLPLDPGTARRRIYDKRSRHGDAGTVRFVMGQVLAAVEASPLDRIEAAKVLAYRAMEAGDGTAADEALTEALEQVERAFGFPTGRARTTATMR